MNPFVILQYPQPPCHECTAECCTPVPFFRREYDAAIALLHAKPIAEVARLAKQKREINRCMFVDMENYTCSVYEARPTLCRLFARHPKGVCDHRPEAAQELSQEEADREMRAAHWASGGEVVGVSGMTLYPHVREISKRRLSWKDVLESLLHFAPPA